MLLVSIMHTAKIMPYIMSTNVLHLYRSEKFVISVMCSACSSTAWGSPAGHWMCGRLPVVSCSCVLAAVHGATPTLTVPLIIRTENA